MPIPSKADGNVPFSSKPRYSIVGADARWVYHSMAATYSPDGSAPATAGVGDPEDLTPVVSSAKAVYGFPADKCVQGGLFTHLGKVGLPMVIEDAVLPGNPAVTLVDSEGTLIRTLVTSGTPLSGFPIRLAAGEYIKVVGGTAGSDFGLFVRLHGVKIL